MLKQSHIDHVVKMIDTSSLPITIKNILLEQGKKITEIHAFINYKFHVELVIHTHWWLCTPDRREG